MSLEDMQTAKVDLSPSLADPSDARCISPSLARSAISIRSCSIVGINFKYSSSGLSLLTSLFFAGMQIILCFGRTAYSLSSHLVMSHGRIKCSDICLGRRGGRCTPFPIAYVFSSYMTAVFRSLIFAG